MTRAGLAPLPHVGLFPSVVARLVSQPLPVPRDVDTSVACTG
jgi:hypothetical protein